MAVSLVQEHARIRTDATAAEFGGTPVWGNALDSHYGIAVNTPFRIRFVVSSIGTTSNASAAFQLYASKNGGAYAAVTTGAGGSIQAVDATAGASADNSAITTSRLGGTGTFQNVGEYDDTGATAALVITFGKFVEFEFGVQIHSGSVGDYYDFRVYFNSLPLGTYTFTPRVVYNPRALTLTPGNVGTTDTLGLKFASSSPTPKFGTHALQINDSDSWASVGSFPTFPSAAHVGSIQAWVNFAAAPAQYAFIVGLYAELTGTGDSCFIAVDSATGGAQFVYTYSSGLTHTFTSANICNGAWHLLEWSFSASGAWCFVDGVQLGTSADTALSLTGPLILTLVAQSAQPGYGPTAANAFIDEVSLWSTTLHTANYTPPTVPWLGSEAGLTALYHLDNSLAPSLDASMAALSATATALASDPTPKVSFTLIKASATAAATAFAPSPARAPAPATATAVIGAETPKVADTLVRDTTVTAMAGSLLAGPSALSQASAIVLNFDATDNGTYWTVPDYSQLTVTVKGPGGGGGGGALGGNNRFANPGGPGAGHSIFGSSTPLDAANGGGGTGAYGGNPTGNNGSSGANGTASGGDINTTGGANNGGIGGTGASSWTGGYGGDGGLVTKTWDANEAGAPVPGSTILLTIRTGGAGGTSTDDGYGYPGADGSIDVTYSAPSYATATARGPTFIVPSIADTLAPAIATAKVTPFIYMPRITAPVALAASVTPTLPRSLPAATATALPGPAAIYLLTENTANNLHYVLKDTSSIPLGTVVTLSAYFHAGVAGGIILGFSDGTNNYWGVFNVSDGTITNINYTNTSNTGTITALGNGWYRCTLTSTMLATGTLRIQLLRYSGSHSFLGTTGSVYAYNVQYALNNTSLSAPLDLATFSTQNATFALQSAIGVAPPAFSSVASTLAPAQATALAYSLPAPRATYSLTADSGVFAATGSALATKTARQLPATTGSLVMVGVALASKTERKLSVLVGVFAAIGAALAPITARNLSASAATFATTGAALAAVTSRKLALTPGAFLETGAAGIASAAHLLSALTGLFTAAGSNSTTVAARFLAGETGLFTELGNAVTIGFGLLEEPGVFIEAGQAGATGFGLLGDTGAFSTIGSNATPRVARHLPGTKGNFINTGSDLAHVAQFLLSAPTGLFLIQGAAASVDVLATGRYFLQAETGLFIKLGSRLSLVTARKLAGAKGNFTASGFDSAAVWGSALQLITLSGDTGHFNATPVPAYLQSTLGVSIGHANLYAQARAVLQILPTKRRHSDFLVLANALVLARYETFRRTGNSNPIGRAYNEVLNDILLRERLDKIRPLTRVELFQAMEVDELV